MKTRLFPLCVFLFLGAPLIAADAAGRANLTILDAIAVENLRLRTAVAEPGDFEETVFALGRIDVYPGRRAVVSSRIPGRALEVNVKLDHPVRQGEVAVVVESRQFGEPPPVVRLSAPISGLVSATYVVPGQPVDPDKPLAEIVDLSEVYALARVPEHLAGRLKPGQLARISAPAVGDTVFEAELEHLGVLADPESGTVEAAFHVRNPGLRLRPGMRAEFSIVTDRHTGVTTVPRSALQGDAAQRFVYVKDFDLPHAFLRTPVVVGRSNDRFVEIVRGLLPADEVVTEGAYSLAFAGAGSVSLKAALDAAHGHAHAEDGSELPAGAARPAGAAAGHGHSHGHDHGHGDEHPERPWQILSGVLFLALLAVGFRRPRGAPPAQP